MNLTILDSKALNNKQWLLCKGSLNEYLENLKPEFYKFSIQRKIVKNQYLDSLVKTIKSGDPIPLITLTYNDPSFSISDVRDITIDMGNVEILDGLQRSFRLWAYYVLIKEYERTRITNPTSFAKEIKTNYPIFFDTGIVNLSKIKTLYADGEFEKIKSAYNGFEIYFIIWANLTPQQVINKMLVLNAGQRSVSKTHQFELLFLYLWEELQTELPNIHLYREKDEDSNRVKAGERSAGDYMFTSVIVGLRSFLEKKPLRVSVYDLDFSDLNNDESYREIDETVFNAEFIRSFLKCIREIDETIIDEEGDEGKKWFVKDTTLSGLLAGIGEYVGVSNDMDVATIQQIAERGFRELKEKSHDVGFNLSDFKEQYNVLSSRSVNIGDFIRKVIMHYTIALLKGEQKSWESIFRSNLKKDML